MNLYEFDEFHNPDNEAVMKEKEKEPKQMVGTCPDCGGDGIETCNNPDHTFIDACQGLEVNRIGCPVCGHRDDHKVGKHINGKWVGYKCETCNGTGKITR